MIGPALHARQHVVDVHDAEREVRLAPDTDAFLLAIEPVPMGVVARIGCQVLTQAFATTTDMLNAA